MAEMEGGDEVVASIPIYFANTLAPNLHLHQYPLLTRSLAVPPSAELSGKRIRARYKPKCGKIEVHVPLDTRPDVFNAEKGREMGEGRAEEDRLEAGESAKGKAKDDDEDRQYRLNEVRMASEKVPMQGVYMVGVMRDGELHLQPITDTLQLRPTMGYLDALSKKANARRGAGSDSDSEGPPPDPDDPTPVAPTPKKEKKGGPAKEVQVTARKVDPTGQLGGLSTIRREMLLKIREEAEEKWENLGWRGPTTVESEDTFDMLFSSKRDALTCTTSIVDTLADIKGL
ncbi:hypothetical protein BOTBODRAFT_165884 [Botryobasidium botryosum FD-172 SS1]|uniref:DNA-directed RNA polymerase III subunit Rpc5 n=1 Tax=Botryobasidium botryosum (strain FD-172 SS1) TaxID=930990 RepID=A0A067MA38_BOTB1|nr:hypothetical protein BOTBODRAFT_165884 [Botryobasidium botryosum FD-172 SS1]